MTEPNQQLVEAVIELMLADLRGRRLLKWLFRKDADTSPVPIGYVDGPIDLETQHEICRSLALAAIQATDGERQRLRSALGDAVAFVRDLARTDTLIMADTLENRADGWEAALKEQSK